MLPALPTYWPFIKKAFGSQLFNIPLWFLTLSLSLSFSFCVFIPAAHVEDGFNNFVSITSRGRHLRPHKVYIFLFKLFVYLINYIFETISDMATKFGNIL